MASFWPTFRLWMASGGLLQPPTTGRHGCFRGDHPTQPLPGWQWRQRWTQRGLEGRGGRSWHPGQARVPTVPWDTGRTQDLAQDPGSSSPTGKQDPLQLLLVGTPVVTTTPPPATSLRGRSGGSRSTQQVSSRGPHCPHLPTQPRLPERETEGTSYLTNFSEVFTSIEEYLHAVKSSKFKSTDLMGF